MRPLLTTRCLVCTVIVLFSYTILTICVLDLSEIAKFFSTILGIHLSQERQHGRHVHGYGTIMVNVKSLGEMDFAHDEIESTTSYSANKSDCFRLFCDPEKMPAIGNTYSIGAHTRNLYTNDKCNSYITLNNALGRTGNQMFQIAALLGTAYVLDMVPVIEPSFPLARYFKIPNLAEHNFTNFREFGYHRSAKYTPLILDLNRATNWTLRGYFQSWKYFDQAEAIIKRAFRVKDRYLVEARAYISNISSQGHTTVCIHIRRGDFMDKRANVKGYVMADLDFIYRAMDFHRKRWKHVRFVVLSDGMLWCKGNIKGGDVLFSPFYSVAEDMALMTLCDHVVVTSGTFGWWGAWLSGGTTVYFKNYPKPNSWLDKQFYRDDYYPPSWIGL